MDRVDPALELGVVGLPEPFPEAGGDRGRPSVPGADLAHQTDVEADHRAALLADDLGAHLVGDAGGDEQLDVDVPAGRGPQDRDLRVVQVLAVQRDSARA